jgi:drug/metabolite transporter, DME family
VPAPTIGFVSTTTTRRVPVGASLIAIAAGVTWSFGALLARKAESADSWQYLLWRSIAVVLVMEVVTAIPKRTWSVRSSPAVVAWTSGWVMALANVGLFGASLGYVYAIKTTTAANAAFLASITPLVAVIIARIVLNERMNWVTGAAIALATLGLAVMVSSDLSAGNMAGNIAALLSSVGFAVFTVCVRSSAERGWGPVLSGYAVAMIVLCTTVTIVNANTVVPPFADIAYAVVHGGVLIIVGTTAYNYASRHVPAVPMTVFAQSETVFAPLWVFLFLGERPKVATLFGASLILAAIIGKATLDAALDGSIEPQPQA